MSLRIKLDLKKALLFIMAFWIILEGRSIWMYVAGIGGIFRATIKVLIVFTFVLMLLTGFKIDYERKGKIAFPLLIFNCYILLYGVLSRYAFSSLLLWLICVDIIAFSLYVFSDNDEITGLPYLIHYYIKIIYIIAIISLFFWMIGGVLHIIPYTGKMIYTWSDSSNGTTVYSYLGLYYTVGPQRALGITIDRNSAIFSEAPMAALHFSLALITDVFLSKKPSFKKEIVFAIAIASTLSTMALIIVMIAFVGKYMLKKSKNIGNAFFKIIFVIVAMLLGFTIINEMLSIKLQQLSGVWRVNDYEVGYQVWKQNLLLGVGFQNDKAIQDAMPAWRSYNMGFSNSIMQLLAQGGIYFSIPYCICMFKGLKDSIKRRKLNYVLFIMCFLFLFVVSVFTYNFFSVIFLLYLLDFNRDHNEDLLNYNYNGRTI